jgi:hypothetical protein
MQAHEKTGIRKLGQQPYGNRLEVSLWSMTGLTDGSIVPPM